MMNAPYASKHYHDDTRPVKAGDWIEVRMNLSESKLTIIQPTSFAAKHGWGLADKIELDLDKAKELHAKLTTFIEFHRVIDKVMSW